MVPDIHSSTVKPDRANALWSRGEVRNSISRQGQQSFRLRCLAERAVARLIDQARAALDFYVSRATSGWHSELLARSWEGLCGLTGFRRQLRKGIRSNFHGSTQLRPEAGATTRNTSVTEPPRTEILPNPQQPPSPSRKKRKTRKKQKKKKGNQPPSSWTNEPGVSSTRNVDNSRAPTVAAEIGASAIGTGVPAAAPLCCPCLDIELRTSPLLHRAFARSGLTVEEGISGTMAARSPKGTGGRGSVAPIECRPLSGSTAHFESPGITGFVGVTVVDADAQCITPPRLGSSARIGCCNTAGECTFWDIPAAMVGPLELVHRSAAPLRCASVADAMVSLGPPPHSAAVECQVGCLSATSRCRAGTVQPKAAACSCIGIFILNSESLESKLRKSVWSVEPCELAGGISFDVLYIRPHCVPTHDAALLSRIRCDIRFFLFVRFFCIVVYLHDLTTLFCSMNGSPLLLFPGVGDECLHWSPASDGGMFSHMLMLCVYLPRFVRIFKCREAEASM